MNISIRQELLRLKEQDLRDELMGRGELEHRYHPRMERIHTANAKRPKEIIAQFGWPGRTLVGEDGAQAAWLVLQHSIGDPPFSARVFTD